MRSKLGTQSRLAAHILAFIFLVWMLAGTPNRPIRDDTVPPANPVAATPAAPVPAASPAIPNPEPPRAGTLDRVATPVVATRVEPEALRPETGGQPPEPRPAPDAPGIAAGHPAQPATIEKGASPLQPPEEPLRPPAEDAEPESADGSAPTVDGEEPSAVASDPVSAESAPDAESVPSAPQPDESGAMGVAAPENGAGKPMAASTPLFNANLEVLDDGVYWLSSHYDLEHELASIPELRGLILLAPLPGYHSPGFGHVKTQVVSADAADLTRDAAERFIHLTESSARPIVVAVLPGARGAAFFKGAYLLEKRAMSDQEMLREIEPELEEAGDSRDDIVHRLARLED